MARELVVKIRVEGFEDPLTARVRFDGFEDPLTAINKLRMFEEPLFMQAAFEGIKGPSVRFRSEPLK